MINLHERMLPTSAGVEPATSWSPVGRASNWATEAGSGNEVADKPVPPQNCQTTEITVSKEQYWMLQNPMNNKGPNQSLEMSVFFQVCAMQNFRFSTYVIDSKCSLIYRMFIELAVFYSVSTDPWQFL